MKIRIHSFADVDRSGKVRWTALELGLEVEEARMRPGEHKQPGYLAVNPYGQIPAAQIDGAAMIESSAICRSLADRVSDPALVPSDPEALAAYHQWASVATETLEYPSVMVYLAKQKFVDKRFGELLAPSFEAKLGAAVERLPRGDFLVPGQFTLADIFMSYSLRLALQGEVITFDDVAAYLEPLMARPAAKASNFFASIEG
ncbi:MAG: glutathione S-transferase family protein [Pseudomonadota bacterium]